MNPYRPDPVPADRETHNRIMEAASIRHGLPITIICPDCYLPATRCRHLLEPDLACLFHAWPGEAKR